MTDFGLARHVKKSELLNTNCGSYVYTAPEVMEGKQYDGAQADIWSMGRLLEINSVYNCHCSTHSARRPLLKSCIFVPSEYVFKLLVGRLGFFLSCTKIKFEIDPQTTEFSKIKKKWKKIMTKLLLLKSYLHSKTFGSRSDFF